MEQLPGPATLTPLSVLLALNAHLDLATLGAAYLLLLANVLLAAIAYTLARALLVISPNSAARDYGIYMAVLVSALLIATVLENELRPAGPVSTPYAAAPHLALLLVVHLAIYYRQTPWLVALGISCTAGAIPLLLVAGLTGRGIPTPHWIAAALACALLAYVWIRSISTKRGFLHATSIYAASKEQRPGQQPAQRPWLGLPQWVGLVTASLALASLNELLRGHSLAQVAAQQVVMQALVILGATTLVCAVPATSYWWVRKAWMPELTRVAWLVWLVVGFALTYGNYLTSLRGA